MCVHAWVDTHACVFVHLETKGQVSLQERSTLCVCVCARVSVCVFVCHNLRPNDKDRLAGQVSPDSCLSLPPQC